MGSRAPKSYISDLRDSPKKTSGKSSEENRKDGRDHRRLVMYLSVGGVMALVVALWVMVLPIQFGRVNQDGLKSVFSPSKNTSEDASSIIAEWRASVDGAQRSIMNLSDGLDFETIGEASVAGDNIAGSSTIQEDEPAVTLDVEKIREKLDTSAEPRVGADEGPVQP